MTTLGLALVMLGSALLGAGCAPANTPWRSSPLASAHEFSVNEGERRPVMIVLHHTGEASLGQAISTLTDAHAAVSAHYLIGREGQIVQLVDERRRAWHAGVARWGPLSDINSISLGIELDNDGSEPYPDVQIQALIGLLEDLTSRYGIDPRNVVAHGDIAPGRKDDPNAFFPWSTLAAHGIGLWCEHPSSAPSHGLDEASALRLVGYQAADDRQLLGARNAFRNHFLASTGSAPLDDQERSMLACIAARQASMSAINMDSEPAAGNTQTPR